MAWTNKRAMRWEIPYRSYARFFGKEPKLKQLSAKIMQLYEDKEITWKEATARLWTLKRWKERRDAA